MPDDRRGAAAENLRRVVLILVAAVVVTAVTVAIEGWPSAGAPLRENRVYGPTMPFGLVQFFSQAALFGLGVTVARRVCRVRL